MSSTFEEEDEGGAMRPSEASKESQEAFVKVVSQIVTNALGPDGKLTPEAEFQIAVRDPSKRVAALENLIAEICPNQVALQPWLRWLNGGPSPFKDKKLEWVGPSKQRPSRTLENATHRVVTQTKKVEKLRAELELEEERLEAFKSVEDAALQWHVVDGLLSILSPVFAMGPAWTIMRSMSGYLSDELAEDLTDFYDPEARPLEIAALRERWKKESEEIFEALDFFAGHPQFEYSLRDAISKVTRKFNGDKQRCDEWRAKGGRRRGKEAIQSSVNKTGLDDGKEVLDGFPDW